MTKTSFIIGLTLALIVHGLIFWLSVKPAANRPENTPTPVRLRQPAPPPATDEFKVAEHEAPRPVTPADPPAGFADMARPQADDDRLTTGDSPTEPTDDSIPPLRIVWEGPDELAAVASALGMKVVAVNVQNEIVGEVRLVGRPELLPFNGDLHGFSNRVRTLEPAFFGSALAGPPPVQVRSLWVLVPASHDARFIELQRDALRRVGIEADAVQLMDARFESAGRHDYRLSITQIHQKEGS